MGSGCRTTGCEGGGGGGREGVGRESGGEVLEGEASMSACSVGIGGDEVLEAVRRMDGVVVAEVGCGGGGEWRW